MRVRRRRLLVELERNHPCGSAKQLVPDFACIEKRYAPISIVSLSKNVVADRNPGDLNCTTLDKTDEETWVGYTRSCDQHEDQQSKFFVIETKISKFGFIGVKKIFQVFELREIFVDLINQILLCSPIIFDARCKDIVLK